MTNREKFREVFNKDIHWSRALKPQILALKSAHIDGIDCMEEWLNSEYAERSEKMTIELSEYVIDAIADAVVKKMQKPCSCEYYDAENQTCRRSEVPIEPVLDKIRAEIDSAKMPKNRMSFFRDGIECALEIIDKYKAEKQ